MTRGKRPAGLAVATIVACVGLALPAVVLADDVPFAEQVHLTDSVTVLPPVEIDVAEQVTLADAPSVLPPVAISIAENVTAQDSVSVLPPAAIDVAENISATDSVAVLPPVPVTLGENLSVSDTVGVLPPASVVAAETVHLSDGDSVLPPAEIDVAEQTHLSDAISPHVMNMTPVLDRIPDATVDEGSVFTAAASFTDPDPQTWIATVDYGDGTAPVQIVPTTNRTFALVHTYADNGTYTVHVTVTDPNAASDSTSLTVTVRNVAPSATISNSGPIDEGGSATVSLSNVIDPSPVDTAAGFTYAFDCGSGYVPAAGPSTTCPFDDNGTYPVKAKVTDKDGGSTELTTDVVVRNVAPTATLGNSGPVGEGSAVTVAFTGAFDPSLADTAAGFHYAFACDGAPIHADYASAGLGASVSCTFPDNGTYVVGAAIIDKDGGTTLASTTVTVTNVAPVADLGNTASVDEGSSVTVSFTNAFDPSPADTAAGFRYQFDCGSGFGALSSSPSTTCTWDDGPSTHTVHGRILDKDGGMTERTNDVQVRNVAPSVNLGAPAHVSEGSPISLVATGAHDPSVADTAAGFKYAFDCGAGAGFGAFGTTTSVSCPTTDSGVRTVGVRIQDKDSGTTTVTATVVVDNVAPTATLNTPAAAVPEGSSFTIRLDAPIDPSPADTTAGFTYRFDCGTGYGPVTPTPSTSCVAVDNPGVTVKASIFDKDGGTTQYTAVVPIANVTPMVRITTPADGTAFVVGTTVAFGGAFADPGVLDTHTAVWSFDAITIPGTVTESGGSGTVAASMTFAHAGVYTVTLSVRDKDGAVGQASILIAVTDPNGFVTGGAFQRQGSGKMDVQLEAKYQKSGLSGSVRFTTDSLSFSSTALQWLVVAGNSAQIRGTGTLGGAAGYTFLATIVDGSPDRFRIKIWNTATGAVAFDTVPGAPDDLDLASPAPVDGGSLTIH